MAAPTAGLTALRERIPQFKSCDQIEMITLLGRFSAGQEAEPDPPPGVVVVEIDQADALPGAE